MVSRLYAVISSPLLRKPVLWTTCVAACSSLVYNLFLLRDEATETCFFKSPQSLSKFQENRAGYLLLDMR